MKTITIELEDDQYSKMIDHISEAIKLNQLNETFSGYGFNISCLDEGVCFMTVEAHKEIDIGMVNVVLDK